MRACACMHRSSSLLSRRAARRASCLLAVSKPAPVCCYTAGCVAEGGLGGMELQWVVVQLCFAAPRWAFSDWLSLLLLCCCNS